MARYIDAEALTAEFKRLSLGENSLIERIFADGVYAVIDTFPTAEVVEKQDIADRLEIVINARKQVASEIFSEIEFDIQQLAYLPAARRGEAIENIIANLKKKYTKGD